MSIANEITRIQNAKSSIKTAIENKGVTVGDGLIDTYASKINEISTGGETIEINNCDYLFYYGARTEQIDDILSICKNVTSAQSMFYSCTKLTTLDLSSFDTSKVTNMAYMFNNCSELNSLNVSNFDTSNVIDMQGMFQNCNSLLTLDLSSFDTSGISSLSSLFSGCIKLTTLDLSSFDTSKVTNMAIAFQNCQLLTSLDLSKFDAGKITSLTSAFYGCGSLTSLSFMTNLGKGYTRASSNYSNYKLDIHWSNNLTHDSLMDIINKLYDLNLSYDVAGGGILYTQQLIIGSNNMAKLTSEEIAIATNKGWVVS